MLNLGLALMLKIQLNSLSLFCYEVGQCSVMFFRQTKNAAQIENKTRD